MEPKFEFREFIYRTRLKQREVADKVESTPGLVGHWAMGRGVPSYEKLGTLIEMGMTAQEMFGKELGDLLVRNSGPVKGQMDGEAVKEAVRASLVDLLKSL